MKRFFPLAALAVISMGAAAAAPAAVPPAPTLSTEIDSYGRPIPFGRAPYLAPETPLGTGARKAIMATDDSLPAHVLYYPADLATGAKLPVIAWGNGACINAGNRFRIFLTEIASHGYLVAANGVMGNAELEVGPQENPVVRTPGAPPAGRGPAPSAPAAASPSGAAPARAGGTPPAANDRAPGATTAAQLTETLDWATKVNADPKSKFYGKLDISKIAVMGQSCGGAQALSIAADPRLTTMMIFNSGAGMMGNNPPAQTTLDAIHTPIAFIHGEQSQDIAFPSATANAQALTKVPVFGAWQDGMSHIGTYGAPGGGFFGKIAVAWLDWQLKSDQAAARMFKGADCILCTAPSWHVTKKRID